MAKQNRESCHHNNVDQSTNICSDCGHYVTDQVFVNTPDYDDQRNVSHRRKIQKPLYSNRANIKLPDDVIDRAESISREFKNIKHNRDKRLIRRQFVCLYYACLEIKSKNPYRELNINPNSIAGFVGLHKGQVSKALTEFSQFQTGYRPAVVTDTKFVRLPCVEIALDIAQNVGIPRESYQTIEDMIETAYQKSGSKLESRTAQTVASSAIVAYNSIFSANLELNDAFKGVGQTTSESVSDIIIEAYNN